jgi:transposase
LTTEQENALLKERIAALENTVQSQQDLIRRIQQMLYGQKRERFEQPDNQLDLFAPVPEPVKEELEEQAAEQITVTYTRQKQAHPGRCEMPADLEVVETIIEPDCDTTDMVCVGEEVSDKLGYQPERFYIERTIRRKYAPKSGEGAFAIAPMPEQVIEKGIPTANLLVQILIDKYVDHLPLYRIRQRFARSNIIIPESTIDGWVKTCLERLEILYNYCKGLLEAQTYLQVDETTIKVQDPKVKGDTFLGYYWAYHAPITLLVLFEYKPGRGGKHVWETLKKFFGYLQTDGYAGYNQIAARDGIVHLACLAHIRRKFFDTQNNDKARAQKALVYIQKLYAIEDKATEMQLTAEQRKELRLTESLPIINEMAKWIAAENKLVLPKSAIGKAFLYAIERWEEMSNYLLDGNLLIDNNLIENQIRPIALGRKNYLFAGSHEAAQRAAIIYTFMAQCKLAKVNPNEWLAYVLTNLQNTKINQLEKLLPKNFGK